MNLSKKTAVSFFFVILVSLVVVYYAPAVLSFFWFILLLFLYWKSKDEPFWFVLFLVLSDGFMGFFGAYQATIPLLPGMPPVEVAQFYIVLSVLKARNVQQPYQIFFNKFLSLMGAYVLFLIGVGIIFGVHQTPNDYFRIVKLTLPLLLFYSVPRLMRKSSDYIEIFSLIFPIAILALITQLFDIITGQSFAGFLGTNDISYWDVMEGRIYRMFYNVNIILMAMFGALYYLVKRVQAFNLVYLYIVILSAASVAYLSATRGWIIGFGVVLILFGMLLGRENIPKLIFFLVVGLIAFIIAINNPFIGSQITRSYERLATVESVTEGDFTAGGTATRATDQSLRVMNKWKESPVFGWGFSEEFRRYINEHVGNQNILLHSGLLGAALMLTFFIFFHYNIFMSAVKSKRKELFVFSVFFLGWFIIHSTSGQHFAYYQMPKNIMAQSLFFSFGAFCYWDLNKKKNV